MRTGERCVARFDTRFAYGPDGCPATQPGDVDLPPNSDIELTIELIEVLSTTAAANMTPAEKIVEFQRRKSVGNEHFARKAFKKALRSYASVLSTISGEDFPHGSDLVDDARQLQIDCGNNISMTYMRLGDLEKAKEAAVGVLLLDSDNAKALFRAGQVSSLQGNFGEAKLALRQAFVVNPESKEIHAELGRLSARMKTYHSKKQAIQEKMGRSLLAGKKGESGSSDNATYVAEGAAGHGFLEVAATGNVDDVCKVHSKSPLVAGSGWRVVGGRCWAVNISLLVAFFACYAAYVFAAR